MHKNLCISKIREWTSVTHMGYIDIHAHIVPGVDDGSKSNRESVEMLKQAYAEGITTVIATPHYSKGFQDYETEDIKKYCKALEKHAKKHICPEFQVFAGQEIFYSERSLEMIQNGEVISLAGSNYILLEFAPEITYTLLFQALREIAMTPYYPVLAHVERYSCLREQDRIEEIRALGVMLQMNYSHVGGKWFDADTKWCRQMLKQGYVDILSTDMHNSTDRGPRMEAAVKWMKKRLDETYLDRIMRINAQEILGIREAKDFEMKSIKEQVIEKLKEEQNEQ